MSYATANGVPCVQARVSLPRDGAWTAALILDTDEAVTGRVAISLQGLELIGTARIAASYAGATHLRVTGGAGGLGIEMQPRAWTNVPLRVPLDYLLAASSETLSQFSDTGILESQLPFWSMMGEPAGAALAHMVDQHEDAVWRMTPEGKIWIGRESWPEVSIPYEVVSADPLADSLTIYSEVPAVYPGTSFLGRRVSYVEHTIGETARTRVLFEEERT